MCLNWSILLAPISLKTGNFQQKPKNLWFLEGKGEGYSNGERVNREKNTEQGESVVIYERL